MSILEELYSGNINPSEKYVKSGSKYQELSNELTEHIERLMALLNGEEKRLYKKIENNISDLNYITEKESFIEGFCVGAQITWEIMHFKSGNLLS